MARCPVLPRHPPSPSPSPCPRPPPSPPPSTPSSSARPPHLPPPRRAPRALPPRWPSSARRPPAVADLSRPPVRSRSRRLPSPSRLRPHPRPPPSSCLLPRSDGAPHRSRPPVTATAPRRRAPLSPPPGYDAGVDSSRRRCPAPPNPLPDPAASPTRAGRRHPCRRLHPSRRRLSPKIAAVGYTIMTMRSPDISWQMRSAQLLPMFLVPALAALIYSAITSLTKMLDNRDQHNLEKLRAERQAKIDELKERINYYMTQQLIQRYDLDPAAKAAAASVLASKLGADSGLRIFLGDESNRDATLSKSNEQRGQSTGLRQRKPGHLGGTGMIHASESLDGSNIYDGNEGPTTPNGRTVEHFRGPAGNDGGWLARVAALLVGEDPTQCFALICGNCHMHNGLARKEDFAFITYYCPHCNALNGLRQHEDNEMVPNAGEETPTSHSDGSSGQASASLGSSNVSSPVARNSPTVEELPAENPVASDLPTVEELPAESPAATNLQTVEELPVEDIGELPAENTGEKANSDQPVS